MDHSAALELVYEAIDAANELRSADKQIPRAPDIALTGPDGALDSLGLATTLLAIERRIEDATGEAVVLLDDSVADVELAMKQLETPDSIARMIVETVGG